MANSVAYGSYAKQGVLSGFLWLHVFSASVALRTDCKTFVFWPKDNDRCRWLLKRWLLLFPGRRLKSGGRCRWGLLLLALSASMAAKFVGTLCGRNGKANDLCDCSKYTLHTCFANYGRIDDDEGVLVLIIVDGVVITAITRVDFNLW